MADAREGLPEHREDESLVERNLRTRNVDVYMPAFKFITKHHRTNKIIERRLPLFVGYVFVHLPESNFEYVRKVDGVMCFLRGRENGPIQFHEDNISKLLIAEFEAGQKYRYKKIHDEELERLGKIDVLRKNLRQILPKGRGVRINMRAQADKAIQTLSGASRDRLQGLLAELDSLSAVEDEYVEKAA